MIDLDLMSILEIFGVNGTAGIGVAETCPSDGPNMVALEIKNSKSAAFMTSKEARYLAGRLTYLADKTERKQQLRKAAKPDVEIV